MSSENLYQIGVPVIVDASFVVDPAGNGNPIISIGSGGSLDLKPEWGAGALTVSGNTVLVANTLALGDNVILGYDSSKGVFEPDRGLSSTQVTNLQTVAAGTNVTDPNIIEYTKDVVMTANLTILGDTVYANVTEVSTADTIITLNNGDTSTASTGMTNPTTAIAGLEVYRGSNVAAPPFKVLFRENDDTLVIGEDTSLQAVATREDAPNTSGIPFWDSTNNQFLTTANLTVSADTESRTTIESRDLTFSTDSGLNQFDFGSATDPSSRKWLQFKDDGTNLSSIYNRNDSSTVARGCDFSINSYGNQVIQTHLRGDNFYSDGQYNRTVSTGAALKTEQFRAYNAANNISVGMEVEYKVDGAATPTAVPMEMTIKPTDASGTTRNAFYISSTANVGIQDINPERTFTVNGDIKATGLADVDELFIGPTNINVVQSSGDRIAVKGSDNLFAVDLGQHSIGANAIVMVNNAENQTRTGSEASSFGEVRIRNYGDASIKPSFSVYTANTDITDVKDGQGLFRSCIHGRQGGASRLAGEILWTVGDRNGTDRVAPEYSIRTANTDSTTLNDRFKILANGCVVIDQLSVNNFKTEVGASGNFSGDVYVATDPNDTYKNLRLGDLNSSVAPTLEFSWFANTATTTDGRSVLIRRNGGDNGEFYINQYGTGSMNLDNKGGVVNILSKGSTAVTVDGLNSQFKGPATFEQQALIQSYLTVEGDFVMGVNAGTSSAITSIGTLNRGNNGDSLLRFYANDTASTSGVSALIQRDAGDNGAFKVQTFGTSSELHLISSEDMRFYCSTSTEVMSLAPTVATLSQRLDMNSNNIDNVNSIDANDILCYNSTYSIDAGRLNTNATDTFLQLGSGSITSSHNAILDMYTTGSMDITKGIRSYVQGVGGGSSSNGDRAFVITAYANNAGVTSTTLPVGRAQFQVADVPGTETTALPGRYIVSVGDNVDSLQDRFTIQSNGYIFGSGNIFSIGEGYTGSDFAAVRIGYGRTVTGMSALALWTSATANPTADLTVAIDGTLKLENYNSGDVKIVSDIAGGDIELTVNASAGSLTHSVNGTQIFKTFDNTMQISDSTTELFSGVPLVVDGSLLVLNGDFNLREEIGTVFDGLLEVGYNTTYVGNKTWTATSSVDLLRLSNGILSNTPGSNQGRGNSRCYAKIHVDVNFENPTSGSALTNHVHHSFLWEGYIGHDGSNYFLINEISKFGIDGTSDGALATTPDAGFVATLNTAASGGLFISLNDPYTDSNDRTMTFHAFVQSNDVFPWNAVTL